MRVTQRSVSRNYMRNLNNTLAKRASAFERGTTGAAFDRLSQNVADGVRAMKIQEERQASERQLSATQDVIDEMNSVFNALDSIDDIMKTVDERVVRALSEEGGEPRRQAIAAELHSMKEQILQFANSQYSGKYLFSDSANAAAPFGVGADGKLTYNGIPMSKIDRENGTYIDEDGFTRPLPNDKAIYIDLGLGMRFEADDGDVDTRTAFKTSFSGLDVLGHEPNVYDLITDMEEALGYPNGKAGGTYNRGALESAHTAFDELTDDMRLSRLDLDTRAGFLNQLETRLESDITTLTESESNLVSADPSEEAIKLKESEYTWMAVLQLGAKLLPTSLLDFLS